MVFYKTSKSGIVQKITVIDANGNTLAGYIPDAVDNVKDIQSEKRNNIKEHLYIAYLMFGTFAFALTVYFSLKRVNS